MENNKITMEGISPETEGNCISVYLGWLKKGTLETSINFQRNFVWPVWKRSNLVLSAIINLPIPAVYVYRPVKGNKIKKVFDGRQRLTTLQQFAENMFPLDVSKFPFPSFIVENKEGGKEYTKEELNGKTFAELPEDIQEAFMNKNLKMEIVSGAGDELAEVFFSLMNMGQESLKPQEVRLATMGKKVRDFFNGLKESSLFNHSALSDKQRINNTQHDILAQLALLLHVGITDLSASNVDGFINQFRSTGLPEALQNSITDIITYLSEVTDILVTRKKESQQTNKKGKKADPNKPVKITFLNKLNIVSCACITEKAMNTMSPVKFADFITEFFNNKPSEYVRASSSKTADSANVETRVLTIQQSFDEYMSKNVDKVQAQVEPITVEQIAITEDNSELKEDNVNVLVN